MINVAIFSWPVIATVIFGSLRNRTAIVAAILAAFLLLPGRGGFDLPMLPAFDKTFLSSMLPLILALLMLPPDRTMDLPGIMPRKAIVVLLMLFLAGSMLATALTNGSPIVYDIRFLRGLTVYDAFSDILDTMIMLAPFLLGRKYFGHPDSHAVVLRVSVAAGLCYTLLALYEVRMSPQLNMMIYGYFPHSFFQHFRDGGWRPAVFLPHGLMVSLFFAMTFLAALALWRARDGGKGHGRYLLAALWIFGTLVLCKSLGAVVLAIFGAGLLLLLTPRTQLLTAAVVGGVVLTYPSLRALDLVPTEAILQRAEAIDPARAESLAFRFRSEDILLEKAREKPIFGWGKSGRSRAYTETGQDIAVPDGFWVIQFGIGGWARYLALFGLLSYGLISLAFRPWPVSAVTAGLAVMLAINLLDLLPNAGVTPLTWLLSGAIVGRLEWGRITQQEMSAAPKAPATRDRYSRQTGIHERPRPAHSKGMSRAR